MKQLLRADIMTGDTSVIKNGYIGIDGDTIDYIGQNKPTADYDTKRELKDRLLIPGLFNAHTHSSMVLFRGFGGGLPLERWLLEKIFPVENKLICADISVGTRLVMMEMLAGGTVSFTDMYMEPHTAADEIERAGMKANITRPLLAFDKTEPYDKNFRVRESIELYNSRHNTAGGRIKVDFGIHAEYTNYDEVVRRYGEACKEHGAIMHLHLSETRKEHKECKERNGGKTPAQWFADLGVFDNPTVAAHCVAVESEDIDILLAKDVTIVHNPTSNMKLGSGFMPLSKMINCGVKLALGTDGASSNNNVNMFEEMHLASVIHCGYNGDPTLVSPVKLLQMATVGGAMAQEREDCGILAVGNKADIVALDMSRPHLMPVLDYPGLLTYSAQAGDVAMTMVDGRILYENGEYLTIDAERVRHDLPEAIERLLG